MTIRLRGHHLLCLLGYRGMGYSKEYTLNMTSVYEQLRLHPDTCIRLVEGPDDLCAAFPQNLVYHCEDQNIDKRDRLILERLGLFVQMSLTWTEIEKRISTLVTPDDVPQWCSTCSWLRLGVCAEGVANLRAGIGMIPLPETKRESS